MERNETAAGDGRPIYTVGEVNRAIQAALQASFPDLVWVRGEVQRFPLDAARRKHVYFELHETGGGGAAGFQVQAAILGWDRDRFGLGRYLDGSDADLQIRDKLEVCFACKIDFYPPYGRLTLKVVGVDKGYALGRLEAIRRDTLAYLHEQQLLERNAQLPLADLPLRVGLITSAGSAAERDFRSGLDGSPYPFTVDMIDCRMMGEQTERQVIQALAALADRGVDVIVITRGGGSRADLSWFDQKAIAVTIAECDAPVVTAIGHEIDRSIADLVAHRACKTPTAAAEFLVARVDVAAERLAAVRERLLAEIAMLCDRAERRLLVGRELAGFCERRVLGARLDLHERRGRLERSGTARVAGSRQELAVYGSQLATRVLSAVDRATVEQVRRPVRLLRLAERPLTTARATMRLLRPRLVPERLLRAWPRQRDDGAGRAKRLQRLASAVRQRRTECLDHLMQKARLLDPQRLLERGYTLTFDTSGEPIRRARAVAPGDRIDTRFADGQVASVVQSDGAVGSDHTRRQINKGARRDGKKEDPGQETLFR